MRIPDGEGYNFHIKLVAIQMKSYRYLSFFSIHEKMTKTPNHKYTEKTRRKHNRKKHKILPMYHKYF